MKTYQITVGGETFPIKSDADEAHVQSLAREIQERYAAVNNRKGPKTSQGFRAMAMVALVLMDELAELQGRHDSLQRETVDFAEKIAGRIDSILAEGH